MSGGAIKVDGLRQLDAALGELKKGTARAVLRRVLVKAAEPMRAAIQQNAPVRTGKLRTKIVVSAKLVNDSIGKAAFAMTMESGGSRAHARAAAQSAKRDAGEGSFAQVYVGPSRDGFYGLFAEFGTVKQKPKPFMRPAFDANKGLSIDIIKNSLGDEIQKAAKRAAARALKSK